MQQDIGQILTGLISGPASLRQVYFASTTSPAPAHTFQADSPRLELVLEGTVDDALQAQDALYIPAGCGHLLRWHKPATVLSIHFAKQQIIFSLQRWDGTEVHNMAKQNVARRGPRIGSFLLQTLHEMQMQPQEQQTARLIVASLLSHCTDLLGSQIQTASRSQALFEAIRSHIDENYAAPLTRESVAQAFYISPNYLSHLFQKTGAIGFNEYLIQTRLEHARRLLKGYDLKIKDVAHACGFIDSNYFCRLFRKHTERSPSEYRRQYHSQLTDIDTEL